MNRRDLLERAAHVGAGISIPSLYGLPVNAGADNALHLQVAEKAKAFKSKKKLKILLPEGSQANVQPCIDLFAQLTGIQCEISTTPVDDINAHMFASSATESSGYDVALPATFGIPDLAENNVIADLSSYRQKYEPAGLSANSLYTQGDSYRDCFYGYQTDGDSYLLFFNKALVTEDKSKAYSDTFGQSFAVPSTWQELDAQMAFFNQPKKNQYGGLLFRTPDYVLWEWWLRFHAKGMIPLNKDLKPNIDTDEGVEALDELIKATQSQHVNTATNTLFENWQQYSQGQCYANIGWGGTQKFLNKTSSSVKDKLLFSVPPGDKNSNIKSVPYFNWGWNYTVSSSSTQLELAYLFSLFSVCPFPSTVAVRQVDGYFDPFRIEHYQDEVIQKVYSSEFAKVHKQSMTQCIPDFYMAGRNRYFGQLRKYLNIAIQGKMSSKKSLSLAAKSWEKLHIHYDKKRQSEQWQMLRRQYNNSGFRGKSSS